jgi:gamma-glutamyltranspeptidase/glutathione hydrolase
MAGDLADATSVHAPAGMVATADQLASSAGLGLLRDGGTAVDAAIAASAVLAVTSPHMCGMGGDLWALVHVPGEPVAALCAAGRAGSGADPLQLRAEDHEHMPPEGDIRVVTIPGCVDGWLELHRRYGRLPLAQVLEPAITYAAAGFPASPLLAATAPGIVHLRGAGDFREPAMATGGRLLPGTMIRRPGVAANLGAIVAKGRSGFYQGPFGDGLLLLGAGLYQRADLARIQAEWVEPVHAQAWGHDLWAPPPPSQGYLTLAAAAVASELGLPADPDDPAWAHTLSEAARLVGLDRLDVLYEGADGADLLARDRLGLRWAAFDEEKRSDFTPPPAAWRVERSQAAAEPDSPAPAAGDTTALCVVDRERMAVTVIQSNASGWGANIVEPNTGEFLHARGIGFSLEPGHPAEFAPGRRPPHTLAPALVTAPDGSTRAVLATMGGDTQPQILLQILARVLAGGASAGEAVDGPRWMLGDGQFSTWSGRGPDHLTLEERAPEGWQPGLERRGHRVERATATPDHRFGHAHLVVLDDGMLEGAADPRALIGAAAGY